MASESTRSLEEIRRETERTREGLTSTVSELRNAVTHTASDIRETLSPAAIKSEVSGYFKSRGEELIQNATRSAQQNPLQAAAVGVCVAWPAFRIARSIPLPILMIGAGLFFAGSKKGRELTQQAADAAEEFADVSRRKVHDISDEVTNSIGDAKAIVRHAADQVKTSVTSALDQSQQAVGVLKEGASDQLAGTVENAAAAGSTAKASLSQVAREAADKAAAASGSVASSASHLVGSMQERANEAVSQGQDYLKTAGANLAERGSQAKSAVQQTVEQNPLLVAGIGLILGGLIASALPKLDLEDELMGDASDAVRQRAGRAANDAFSTAKDTADQIISNVTSKAELEGLTPDGVSNGIQDVGQRLRRVAEKGITTAFEPDGQMSSEEQQANIGGKDNG